MANNDIITSPCIGYCKKNDDDICAGCGRTGDEIADWYLASDDRKRTIVNNAAERLNEIQSQQDEGPE